MNALTAAREGNKCKLAEQVLRSSGQLRLRATGTSMLPTVWPGDLLTIRRQPLSCVLPGALVLYTRHNRFFVHRVLRKFVRDGYPMLLTRGDALPQADPPVSPQEFLGAVIAIERDQNATGSHSRFEAGLAVLFSRCAGFARVLRACSAGSKVSFIRRGNAKWRADKCGVAVFRR